MCFLLQITLLFVCDEELFAHRLKERRSRVSAAIFMFCRCFMNKNVNGFVRKPE